MSTTAKVSDDINPEGRAVTYLRVSSKRQMDTAADVDPDGTRSPRSGISPLERRRRSALRCAASS